MQIRLNLKVDLYNILYYILGPINVYNVVFFKT